MKKQILLVTLMLASFSNITAQESDVGLAAATDDRYCTTCHGAEGMGNIALQAPRLAGMEAWYLQRQLQNFRDGIRGAHPDDAHGLAMQPMAAKLSDASIADIISWVGSWKFTPAAITIDANATLGRTAYQNCATCHGAAAQGNEALNAPALAGQNDWYLIAQLNNFRNGVRGSHANDSFGAQMQTMAQTLSDAQAVLNVVSYINTLGR